MEEREVPYMNMKMEQIQKIVDENMPSIRKNMINEVCLAIGKIENLASATPADLSCAMEAVADTILKASAEMFTESMIKVIEAMEPPRPEPVT